MWQRIKHILIKEFLQILRDPRMRGLIFGAPLIQLFVFGYAATTDVKHIPTAIYDLDNTVESRELTDDLIRSGYFDLSYRVTSESQVRDLLDRGSVIAVFRMNKGFAEALAGGRTAQLQILLDGTDSNTAGIVLSYSSRIVNQFSQRVLIRQVLRTTGRAKIPGQIAFQTRAWFNDNLESRNFFVPGVVALLLTVMTLTLTSMAIVREKEIGTIEQIMVTPIRPTEFILGKTVPFVLIGIADAALVTTVGVLWFGVPLRGNLVLLFGATCLALMTMIGVGLLISTMCHTQQQAMMSGFFFIFPANMLSGFIFPISNMPTIIQLFTYPNPLRYFLVIVRGVFLTGVGLNVLWPQFVALAIIGVVTLAVTTKYFRKTLA